MFLYYVLHVGVSSFLLSNVFYMCTNVLFYVYYCMIWVHLDSFDAFSMFIVCLFGSFRPVICF